MDMLYCRSASHQFTRVILTVFKNHKKDKQKQSEANGTPAIVTFTDIQ